MFTTTAHTRGLLDAVRTAWLLAHPEAGGHLSHQLAAEGPGSRTAPDGTPDPAGEAGMATAEYAIGTLAAAAFGGLLLAIIRSGSLTGLLQGIIESALSIG